MSGGEIAAIARHRRHRRHRFFNHKGTQRITEEKQAPQLARNLTLTFVALCARISDVGDDAR